MADFDSLRAPLIAPLERMATDIAIGRYGDPHGAFIVLVYPDEAPTVLASHGGHSVYNLGTLHVPDETESRRERRPERERCFALDDLYDAYRALGDADHAIHFSGWDKTGCTVGEFILDEIRDKWQRRRDNRMKSAMDDAARKARYSAECPHCHSHYTAKGIKTHLARSQWCSRREAERVAQQEIST